MASTYIYLSGKGSWMHRLFEPEEYLGKTSWSMKLYPDPKSLRIFDAAKLLQRKKEDDEGIGITFKRPTTKPWKVTGKESKDFSPPVVVDNEGRPWPSDQLLGNGSEVTLKLEVFQTKLGRTARLESVRIDDWIEYDKPEDSPPEEDNEIAPF